MQYKPIYPSRRDISGYQISVIIFSRTLSSDIKNDHFIKRQYMGVWLGSKIVLHTGAELRSHERCERIQTHAHTQTGDTKIRTIYLSEGNHHNVCLSLEQCAIHRMESCIGRTSNPIQDAHFPSYTNFTPFGPKADSWSLFTDKFLLDNRDTAISTLTMLVVRTKRVPFHRGFWLVSF
jgi:hypothetical protein